MCYIFYSCSFAFIFFFVACFLIAVFVNSRFVFCDQKVKIVKKSLTIYTI